MTSASGLSTVACAAITKSEEHNLPDCRQFVHWVGEVAVIDADSSDRTAHLSRGGGRKKEPGAMPVSILRLAFRLPLSWKTFNRLA